jgi:hypothetical protein
MGWFVVSRHDGRFVVKVVTLSSSFQGMVVIGDSLSQE